MLPKNLKQWLLFSYFFGLVTVAIVGWLLHWPPPSKGATIVLILVLVALTILEKAGNQKENKHEPH